MVSHPIGEALDRLLQLGGALRALELQLIGKCLEMQVVAIAAAIQTEAQHDWHLQCRSQLPWRSRERRRLA